MTSSESLDQQSDKHSESKTPPSMKKSTSKASTVIDMTPAIPSERKSGEAKEVKHTQTHRAQTSVDEVFFLTVSKRLAARKLCHNRLTFITDIMCAISIVSIGLMIVANEITFTHLNDFDMPGRRILLIAIELIVCAVHPMPRLYPTESRINEERARLNETGIVPFEYSYTSIDVALGLSIIDPIMNTYPFPMPCGYFLSLSLLSDMEIYIHRRIVEEITISIIAALIGLFVSALLITVFSQKLTLDRSEKYVHSFVLNTGLAKEQYVHAANIIKYAFKLWILRHKNKARTTKYLFTHQK
ncbi:hypothetical protein I4U23_001336 [Adineta vaga]|nr:hypothetical protein I4U23_001336 [Adineta vaga]